MSELSPQGSNILVPISLFEYNDIIVSYSTGIRSPPPTSDGFLLRDFDSTNGLVIRIGKTIDEVEFRKNYYEYLQKVNSFVTWFYSLPSEARSVWVERSSFYGIKS